jgi:glucosyl-3-phosphoglycerate synthase
MPDFVQHRLITTLHDLGTTDRDSMESLLERETRHYPIGLVLPVTAADMRAEPFGKIITQLQDVAYIDQIIVTMGAAQDEQDYRDALEKIAPLEGKAQILWTDGPRVSQLYKELTESGVNLSVPGKGRSVWTAFGYLLADPRLKAFALHDCDIVNYDRIMLARLCLPMAHSSLDFEFCKAFYARCTDRMHGRVVRLLVAPLLRALIAVLGADRFLRYLDSFRYPLSGEFAVTATLARSNRIHSDWGLEVGTLAEVYRNTSVKRVCQVELCKQYEHKHQDLSIDDPGKGLMKMATDILTTVFRTLSSMGVVLQPAHFTALRSCYLRSAQDAIRQYYADAVINNLIYDRNAEGQAVDGFAQRIMIAGETFQEDPTGGEGISNWARILGAFPNFPDRLRQAVREDAESA